MTVGKFDLHFLVHSISASLRRKDGIPADRYWYPINQIGWELRCLLRESGFIAALPKQIVAITIMSCYDTYYGFDPETAHFDGKKQFKVYVHLDASDYASSPPDEERYWPELAVCLDALCHVATHFDMPQTANDYLRSIRARLPSGPPWPSLPSFDIAEVERYYKEQKSAAIVADDEGRIRVVKPLEAVEGLLWIMLGPIPDASDESIDRLQGDLRTFFTEKELGLWDGDSRNGRVSDMSFEVRNLARSAKAVKAYLKQRWPLLDFVIADEYDPDVFEKLLSSGEADSSQ